MFLLLCCYSPKHLFMATVGANTQGRWTFLWDTIWPFLVLLCEAAAAVRRGNAHLAKDDFCKWEIGRKVYFQICGEVLLTYKQKNWKSVLQKEPVPGAECQCFTSGHLKPFRDSDELFHHVFPSDGADSLFEP